MPKHKKPLSNDPSPSLERHYPFVSAKSELPVADIACGYGRNGEFFLKNGHKCVFCDIDPDCLEFIKSGPEFLDYKNSYETLSIDFFKAPWPFKPESLSGIINVHYFNGALIDKFVTSLCPNGFLYIETISAKGYNYLDLPEYHFIYDKIVNKFNIIYYKENRVKRFDLSKATPKLLATKL